MCNRRHSRTLVFGLGGAALLMGLIFSPVAATAQPVGNWTGFYVGGHIGAGDFSTAIRDEDGTVTDQSGAAVTTNLMDVLGGAHIGYNIQVRAAVFGIEGDYSWTNANESRIYDDGDNSKSADWNGLGSVRLRLGLALDNALVYFTGGYAFVDVKQTAEDTDTDPRQFVKFDDFDALVVGGGTEIKFTQNISFRGEYLYYGLDEEKTNCGEPCDGGDQFADGHAHVARLGLSYHFGGQPTYVEPLK